MENHGFFSARRWLGRLSYSLFILAFYLLYSAYNGLKMHSLEQWRAMVIFAGALFSFVLGLMGVRERHGIKENSESQAPVGANPKSQAPNPK